MDLHLPDLDWSTVFRHSHYPALLLDRELTIVACNAAYEKLTGQSSALMAGRPLFDRFPGQCTDQQTILRASSDYVWQYGKSHHIPLLEYHLNEDRRFWSVVNTPLFDRQGDVRYLLNQPSDITELTRLREELSPFARSRHERCYRPEEVQQILLLERERMRQLFQQAPGFICVLRGPDHIYEMANRAYDQLVGQREIIGHPLAEVLPEVVPQGFLDKLNAVYRTGIPYTGRAVPIALKRSAGAGLEMAYVDLMYQPIRDHAGHISGIFVQGHDVTEAHRLSQEVSYQAVHDPLTGLANRRVLEQESKSLELGDSDHSLLYLDLDHFKIVNDRCGHHAGDELLVQVAEILAGFVREKDILARIGGDEFVLVLKHCTEADALEIAHQLRHAIQGLVFVWNGRRYGVTLSIGLVAFGQRRVMRLSDALSLADSACFLAKEKGRNRVQVSQPDDEEVYQQQRDMDWASLIKEAIADDRVNLWGQKITSLSEPEASPYVELLARLQGADGEIIPPAAFIPAAERFGIVEQLDYHIVRKAFVCLDALPQQEGAPLLFVNLSGVTLSSQDFASTIRQIAGHYPAVSPCKICFEVTETAAITNLARTADAMQQLVMAGFTFALDDFGSGMSSFSYLEQLPVAYVKIDGEFIKGMDSHLAGKAIVEAVTKVAGAMGIITIAEYVEQLEQLPLLRQLGVDRGQGYAIHRPEPLENLLAALLADAYTRASQFPIQ